MSLWLALHHGETFGAALVISPSLGWDDGFAQLDAANAPLRDGARPRLWLDMGGRETERALPALRRLCAVLHARGWPADRMVCHEQLDGRHDEASWAARVEGMLRFLYSTASPAR